MSPSYYDGPRCPDHHGNAAKGCRDCWREVHAGKRFAHEIGHHLEAAPVAASLVSGAKVSKRTYIAGPMRGIKDFNFPAFDTAAKMLAEYGYEPINPADHDREGGFEGIGMTGNEPLSDREDFDLRETLKWDLEQVSHADYVAVLPGWEKSSGARAEVSLANALGVKVYSVLALASDFGPRTQDLVYLTSLFGEEAPQQQTGEVRTTSATGGEKGTKPERYDLIPVEALAQVARLYGRGAAKYAAHNWRKGYEWSKSYAAMQRHATQFWAGEDIDEEMQLPHLASVIFHAMALLVFMEEHRDFDDRYSTTGAAK